MVSARIRSVDPQAVAEAVAAYAARLKRERPEVRRIIWFGSRVSGRPGPGSDVDLCLVLDRRDRPRRELLAEYLPTGFPVGMDLFPCSTEEFALLPAESPGWWAAIAKGKEL